MDHALTRRALLGAGAALGSMLAVKPALASMPLPAPKMRQRPPGPYIFGHRGACAHRPEHTLASYGRAIDDGADFIEPDLVPTKDGVLVARHENNIAETTDVATHPEFASRKAVKMVDGEQQEGWFTEDFTLAELKTLRAKERLGALRPESQSFDGQFPIVTFDEIVAFAAERAAKRTRPLGIVPEIKHSTYFAKAGFDMEALFLARLNAPENGWLRTAPVIVQSFEVANLKRLHAMLADRANVQLMQLLDDDAKQPADVAAARGKLTYGQMMTPRGLLDIGTYADWIAPSSRRILPIGTNGRLDARTTVLADAHRAGLLVAAWTFRPETQFLAGDFRMCGDAPLCVDGSYREIREYLNTGLDAVFTDDPAIGRKAADTLSTMG